MHQIGFIGCGNMGSAMVGGILAKGLYGKEDILVSQLHPEGAAKTRERFGVEAVLDNCQVAREAKLLFLAVKPQFYEEVLAQIQGELTKEHVVVGLAPGKTTSYLKEHCKGAGGFARFMPNTPAQVGRGMTAICLGEGITPEIEKTLVAIAESFGEAQVIPERLMDAAGAVGGCSPAFVYMFIEAMADAAVLEGMPRAMAYRFAAQTCLGAAAMVMETGRHPGDLKDMVTSPGGTTIEGVRTLEKGGFRGTVMEALIACAEKGKGL
ncbi:MAG: pyrroline-5-carboxylate reductase [Blautia sp.]|nr:pyrroline-5-carboxylate reductase [Blautia sp.]